MAQNKEQNKEQDIRIIQLSKWQIPKSKSVMNYMGENAYLSIGYFDMIDVRRVQKDGTHPLLAAYKMSHRHAEGEKQNSGEQDITTGIPLPENPLLENYTMQELIVFADVNTEHFNQKEIDEFWNADSLVIFVSLIHIDNESDVHEIIKNIHSCFKGKKYLVYFSFDYSGIILLAKEMGMREYLRLLFQLNYGNKDRKQRIRDSYSFYGFSKSELKKYFEKFDLAGDDIAKALSYMDSQSFDERFSVSVNVGVQNYNVYKEFREKVKAVSPGVSEYGLFGRHDISLVNEDADLRWLVYVQYLLNKFTMTDEKQKEEHLLSTHETFVKISDIDNFEDTEEAIENEFFELAKEKLNKLCSEFVCRLDEGRYNGEYKIPVLAVKYSILSILKNRFAEDFVLCMYQSFCEFIQYLTEKMTHEDDDVMKFDKCFSDYFRGLNSLVNSAMHSERQFIQATAFNAIIYDVPSKIMAFYMAMVNEFQQMIRGEADNRYTFLLTPSFNNEISMDVISYSRERPPHDRILMVLINESSLYNPKEVIRRMAHEVAHFVGDNLRSRELRKKHTKLSVIYIILSHVLHGAFLETDDIFELIDGIENRLSANMRFSDDEENYSVDLLSVLPDIVNDFCKNNEIKVYICKYIEDMLKIYLGEQSTGQQDAQEARQELQDYLRAITAGCTVLSQKISEGPFYTRAFTEREIQILKNLIWKDIEEEAGYINTEREIRMYEGKISQSVIRRSGSGILNERVVGEFIKSFVSMYSESFADIEMLLLTETSYAKYLEGFIVEERLDVDRVEAHLEDLARISMVVFAMRFTGIWDFIESENPFSECPADAREKLQKLQAKTEEQIHILRKYISDNGKEEAEPYYGVGKPFAGKSREDGESLERMWQVEDEMLLSDDNATFYINEKLFIYLIECIKKSVEHYQAPEKYEKVKKLRKTIKAVSDFKEVETVFVTICGAIRDYKANIPI